MTDWWVPREIIFNREQVMWIIEHLDMMVEGNWPANPQGSVYTMAPNIRQSGRKKAYFETPCQIAAEVEYRLNKTGVEGKLLVSEIKQGLYWEELQPESKRALNYISGWRRRRQKYGAWVKQRRYRNKIVANQPQM